MVGRIVRERHISENGRKTLMSQHDLGSNVLNLICQLKKTYGPRCLRKHVAVNRPNSRVPRKQPV